MATTNVDGDRDSAVDLKSPVDMDRVQVHYFRCTSLRRLYYSPPMRRFLDESMAKWDLVHTHSVFLWPTAAAARIARSRGKPYVLSPRGMLVRDMISRRNALLKRAWISLVERRNVSGAAAIHVTSAVERDELLALGLEARRVFEIPNGIDLPGENADRTAPVDREMGNGYVLFLGRISWKKGLDRLVTSLASSPAIHLVVAGNDDEQYWPVLARQAEGLGVADRIRYIGFVDGERKRDAIARASALVLPSYSENFGNVVLEAMAAGVPVVVTPEVGIAPIVAESRSGLVVPGEPAQLGAALARISSDTTLAAELGANGRAAARRYSWSSIAERMEREYSAILEAAPR